MIGKTMVRVLLAALVAVFLVSVSSVRAQDITYRLCWLRVAKAETGRSDSLKRDYTI
jgi:predicted LPLAT superfamily acyltransferase